MSARVFLQARKARPFFGRHPWVFQSAIERIEGDPAPGDAVRVLTSEKKFIAHGLFNPNSNIRVRLYSWDPERPFDAAMLAERIERAVAARHVDLGLGDPKGACRLVYSESDGLSGLLVDRYADVLAVQFTSLAMARFEEEVIAILQRRLAPRGIYRRTERGIGELEGLEIEDALLAGHVPEHGVEIVEHGLRYRVDVQTGQKTGAFLDQRDNRLAAARYAKGRDVLDLYCYGAAFGIAAARLGGARSVLAVDVSGPALGLAQTNADLNETTIEFRQSDAAAALEEFAREGRRFGMICCDPPKFARTPGAVANALKGYENANRRALELLEPGGILVTSSCSGHVSREDFLGVLVAASQRAERELHVLEQRGQAPDHPVSGYCLETGYLKCILARAAE